MNKHHAYANGYHAYPRGEGGTFSISPHRLVEDLNDTLQHSFLTRYALD
jgi:hypothetical protein